MLWANDWEYGTLAIIICVSFHAIALIFLARIVFHEKVRRFRDGSLMISA
jgi:hypothetical protein